jgi:outer membrane receptor protein involved in Fe transport
MKHGIGITLSLLTILNINASPLFTGEGKDLPAIDTTVVKNILLTEVAVNGNKEPLTLKQLPAASTIMGKKILEDYRPESLRDISYMAPNLFMPEYGSKLTAPVYIRGIGSRLNSPSVGLYVDNVPYMEKSAFDFDFFDVERIEILRGPQGTMYGRNTMGGILLVRTRSPFENPGVVARATAGNYGMHQFNAGIYNAVKEKFGYSLSLNYKHNDGFYRNTHLNSLVDKTDSWGARNKLIWSFNPNLSIENIASFEDSRQVGYPYALYDSNTHTTMPVSYDIESTYDRKLFSDALVVRWNTDKFDLTSNTSFQHLGDEQNTDQDFTPASLFYMIQKQKQNTISQEIVMRSRGDSRYKWVNGIYGFHQGMDTEIDIQSFQAKYIVTIDNGLTTYGGALFHQSFFKLFPKLTLGAGVRLDVERSKLDSEVVMNKTVNLPTGPQTIVTTMADTIYPGVNSDELMPRFSLSYRIGDGELYAVASKGYKTGGFNNIVMKPEDLSFRAERSWNYELGYRFSMFDKFISGEAAAYYIDWRNHQFSELVMNGQGLMIKNAQKSRSRGAELSLTTRQWMGFSMMASYGYTDARFVKYEKSNTENFNDNKIPNAPQNTFMAQANKEIEFKNSSTVKYLRFSATYRGAGRIYWNEENDHYQSFYGLVDASVTAKISDFKLSVWGKNILDEKYHTFFFNTLNNDYVQLGRPATVGVTLEYQLPLIKR